MMRLGSSFLIVCATALMVAGCSSGGGTRSDELLPPVKKQPAHCPPPPRIVGEEAGYLSARRGVMGLAEPGREAGALVGLASSGGGMRSAVINVGAYQGLNDVRVRDGVTALERVDYLSAVSGGSYAASWLVSHTLPSPLYSAYRKYTHAPFNYEALMRLMNERDADRKLSENARQFRATYRLTTPDSEDVPDLDMAYVRMAFKQLGFDKEGFRNSSSYIGDLLADYGDTGESAVMPYGHNILTIRSQAPKGGVSSWGSVPYATGWLARYPVYFTFNLALHWTPTDQMNWHRPTAPYANSVGETFHTPDEQRMLCLRNIEQVRTGAPDFLTSLPISMSLRPIAMSDLNQPGCEAPYLIINANLLNTATTLSYPDSTPAAHFEFTSRWCGADRLGYTPTPAFGRYVLWRDGDNVVTSDKSYLFNTIAVGTDEPFRISDAVAASGAAMDGAAGTTLDGATLTALNLNFRYTTRNAHQLSGWDWISSCGTKTLNFLAEITVERSSSFMRPGSGTLVITDGGHFENTGAFALLRRGVPVIGVVDATYDPEYDWDDLHRLVRITHKLGYTWDFDRHEGRELQAAMFAKDGKPRDYPGVVVPSKFVWRITLTPPPGSPYGPSVLLWCKMSHTGLRGVRRISLEKFRMLDAYKSHHPEFPQKSTTDLTSNVYEWECLRLLGEVMGSELARAIDDELAGSPGHVQASVPASR